MSFRFLSTMNSPPLVAAVGAAVVLGIPALELTSASLAVLKGANALAFLTNVAAVSAPGRLDGQQDQEMRSGDLDPSKPSSTSTPLVNQQQEQDKTYSAIRTRTLINPAGWAFAIWGPIYLGETAFVAAQLFAQEGSALAGVLPLVTAPFVAANLVQSLWCASFRPSYNEGWHKWVSAFMLGGTAYSLSYVSAVGLTQTGLAWWYFLPLTVHFGWTSAATLVNLNGSLSMQESTSDSTVVGVGHASAVTAAALGVGVTLAQSAPAYGLTIAWALAACADGMTRRLAETTSQQNQRQSLKKGAGVQRMLCWAGSALCVGASVATFLK